MAQALPNLTVPGLRAPTQRAGQLRLRRAHGQHRSRRRLALITGLPGLIPDYRPQQPRADCQAATGMDVVTPDLLTEPNAALLSARWRGGGASLPKPMT